MAALELLGSVNSLTVLIGTLTLVLAVKFFIQRLTSTRSSGDDGAPLPPGPRGVPLLGVLPTLLRKESYLEMARWAEQYGDVVSASIAGLRIVVLSSAEAVREAFAKNAHSTADRPKSFFFTMVNKDQGIISTSGHTWKEQRRFALTTLRDFGMGKVRLEESILDEVRALIKVIEDTNGEPFDPRPMLVTSVCNVIFALIQGRRFDHDGPEIKDHIQRLTETTEKIPIAQSMLSTFPWLRHLPGDLFHHKMIIRNMAHMDQLMQVDIDKHKSTYDPDVTRDYIDAFITKMKEEGDTDTTFTDFQLLRVVTDLFAAGTDTSSTTLQWALLYMLHHPELQERLRETITENTAGELVSMTDRNRLVLVDATINEVLRRANIAPGGVPHVASQELTVRGFRIPANTMILSNLWSIHMNPNIWKEPENFDPSRFIDADGKLTRPESFMPFSVGNRSCVGESLAKMEIYLFFACLLKRFRFEPAEGAQPPTLEPKITSTRSPQPYKLRAVKIS